MTQAGCAEAMPTTKVWATEDDIAASPHRYEVGDEVEEVNGNAVGLGLHEDDTESIDSPLRF